MTPLNTIRKRASSALTKLCPAQLFHRDAAGHFSAYFTEVVDRIGSNSDDDEMSTRTINLATFQYYLTLALAARYFALWWLGGQSCHHHCHYLGHADHLLLFDIVHVERGLPAMLNGYIAIDFALLAFAYHRLIFHNNGPSSQCLRQVLDCHSSNNNNSNSAKRFSVHFSLKSKGLKTALVKERMQGVARVLLQAFDVMAMAYYCIMFYFYGRLLVELLATYNPNDQHFRQYSSSYLFSLRLVAYHLLFAHYLLVINICCYVLSLFIPFITVQALVLLYKLQELKRYVGNRLLLAAFIELEFNFVRQHFAVPLLHWLADINRIYGSIISGFIVTTLPLNAILSTMLLPAFNGRLSPLLRLLVLGFVLVQATLLVTFTYFAAYHSAAFHGVTKLLIKFFVKSPSVVRYKYRLRLAHYIAHFHTTNPYTLNLAMVGKMNWAMLGRLLFFYVKFLLCAYKLMVKSG
ncbi:hypothetical protein TYRP_022210 [Tyrophagus putrescentiae]|nr:hypothetical protein TYRP_022210 [Tyrophagus putrescentiae]